MTEPLIYTSKGNLPIASLEYRNYREDVPGAVVFIEEYFLESESVKRAVHVLPVDDHMGGNFGVQVFSDTGKLS